MLLRGDVVDFRMLGSALSDATGNHTVTGTGVALSGGWLDFDGSGGNDATSGLTLSPPLVVNTHQHYDHTNGNQLYPGVTIAAHDECAAGMRAWRLLFLR